METVTYTIRIPKVLWDQREKLLEITGARSLNAMFVGMYVYAMMHGRPHWLTNGIFRVTGLALAHVLDGVVGRFLKGIQERGNYFDFSMDKSVERIAQGKTIPKEAVVAELIEQLRKEGRDAA